MFSGVSGDALRWPERMPRSSSFVTPSDPERRNPEHQNGHPEHRKDENEHGASPQRAPNEVGSSIAPNGRKPRAGATLPKIVIKKFKNAHQDGNGKDPSYTLAKLARFSTRRRHITR